MEQTLRAKIVTEIMKLVKPKMVTPERKPTIDELEKMLNSECQDRIQILPDGSVAIERPNTVGDIADAVLLVVGDVRVATLREAMGKVQADCGNCGGSGHDQGSTEENPMQCEYCGRPNAAIHSLL